MAAKLCKEQKISFGNSAKYSDFIDGKYILLNSIALKRTLLFKKIASNKKICSYFLLKFLVTALIDIINMREEFQLEQKSVTKSRSKFSCEIVLEFQK